MAAWDQWSNFAIRLMSSAGAQLYIWQPSSAVYPIELEITYAEELEDRETVGGSRYPSSQGYRAQMRLTLTTLAATFGGSGVTSALETVIASKQANVGSYYEVATRYVVAGPNWARCNLLNGWKPKGLGANAGLRVTLEFEKAALQLTLPTRDSTGTVW